MKLTPTKKFAESDLPFHEYMKKWQTWVRGGGGTSPLSITEAFQDFTIYTGYVNLAGDFCLYEMYKKIYELAGDIADVGVYKGRSFMLFVKLVKIFEPYSLTQVHGYDWFEGMKPSRDDGDSFASAEQYVGDYQTLQKLVEMQELSDIARIHQLDLTKDLDEHFEVWRHLRFKLCFIDCGIKAVLEEAIKQFWPRVVKGGIMIFDHFCHLESPYESEIIEKYTDCKIRRYIHTRQPTAYVIKE
jgi:hypothetical protein